VVVVGGVEAVVCVAAWRKEKRSEGVAGAQPGGKRAKHRHEA